jgi:hypothetical protein
LATIDFSALKIHSFTTVVLSVVWEELELLVSAITIISSTMPATTHTQGWVYHVVVDVVVVVFVLERVLSWPNKVNCKLSNTRNAKKNLILLAMAVCFITGVF